MEAQYTIFNMKNLPGTQHLIHRPLMWIKRNDVVLANYDRIYSGVIESKGKAMDYAKAVYDMFKKSFPPDYVGRWICTGDIIAVDHDGKANAFYVDRYGLAEIKGFFKERSNLGRKAPVMRKPIMEQLAEGAALAVADSGGMMVAEHSPTAYKKQGKGKGR